MSELSRRLGLRPIVNAVGPATRLGGLPLSDDVLAAMADAVSANVRMDELEEAGGAAIARLLGVPAVYVTSGASAALTLAAAVCVAGSDTAVIDGLPTGGLPRRRAVVQHAHRDPYDHAISAVGLELTEVGFPGSTRPQELARALGPDVALVLWRPGRPGDLLDLATVAELAHQAGVPVLVDAAMDVPPLERLHRLIDDGADLIAVSAGKAFRGPQNAGILCGRPELIAAVALHHQDMDIRESTWQPSDVTGATLVRGRHGIGRGMKVGREQIAGLLVAIEEFVADPGAWNECYEQELAACAAALTDIAELRVARGRNDHLDVPILRVDLSEAGIAIGDVVRQLDTGTPRIHVDEEEAWRDVLIVNPMGLGEGEGAIVGSRIAEIVGANLRSDGAAR